MNKKKYKEVAIRLYYEDQESYKTLYMSVWSLVRLGMLDKSWLTLIYDIDTRLALVNE